MIPITARSGTPSSSSTVAAVCRASCSRASRSLKQRLPLVVVGVRVDWPPDRGCEHPSSVLPELPGGLSLAVLLVPVVADNLDQFARKADRSLTRPRLGVLGVRPDLFALRAIPGLAPTGLVTAPVCVPGA